MEPDTEESYDATVRAHETLGPRGLLVEALEAARSVRAAAIAGAQAKYERTASTLESATAALTVDARRRIEDGPLADARRARDDAMRAAERRFEREVNEAVEGYGGAAVTVLSAAAETMAVLRTDYELYVAVVGAAEAALGSKVDSSRAARATGQAFEGEYKAAEEALAEARRAYSAAAAERNAASRSRPADLKADYGTNILGGLAAGLSEAAGDTKRADAIRRQLERERSERLGEHVARTGRYESRLAEAEAASEAANDALEAATRRFSAASARYGSARQASSSADSDYSAAYEARAAAGIDAARITRVHSVDELEAVIESMREGALSAVAEIERSVLAGTTDATAVQVFESAIATYAEPRVAAIEAALEKIEADYTNALVSAEDRYNDALGRASSVVSKFKRALLAYDQDHQDSVRMADRGLQDALIRHYGKAPGNQDTSDFYGLEAAHRRALEAALARRRQAISRDVPAISSTLAEVGERCFPIPEPEISRNRFRDAQAMVSVVRNYKARRAQVEAKYGDCIERAFMRSAERSAKAASEASQEQAAAGRTSARSVVIARVIGADRNQAERLRALEAAIPVGLLAAGTWTGQ